MKIRIGVQLAPQLTTYPDYAAAVRAVEALGVDTIWNWDHFFPPWNYPEKREHFEAWTLLTAMATLTSRAEIGCMVTCNSYRNPALLSNMAKTVDHISGGRLILGIGAGWFENDYLEYGYTYGSAPERLKALEQSLEIIKKRWAVDLPAPVRPAIPIMIGGGGEKVTLRLAAQYADIWNDGGEPPVYQHKCGVLDAWCEQAGRPPAAVERSVAVGADTSKALLDDYIAAGASHVILMIHSPWDMKPVEKLVEWRASRQALM